MQGQPFTNPGTQPVYLGGPGTPFTITPSGPQSCQFSTSFLVASTMPGKQAALASPNERFVMALHPSGLLDVHDRASNKTLWSVGPFVSCSSPYRLTLLENGQMVSKRASQPRAAQLPVGWARLG